MRLAHGTWMAVVFGAAAIAVAASSCSDEQQPPGLTAGTGGNAGSSGVTMPTGGGAGSSTGPDGGGGCGGDEVCADGGANAVYLLLSDTCDGSGMTERTDLLDCSQCTACQEACAVDVSTYTDNGGPKCDNAQQVNPSGTGCVDISDHLAPFQIKATLSPACTVDLEPLRIRACQLDGLGSCNGTGMCVPSMGQVCILLGATDSCPPGYDVVRPVHQNGGSGGGGGGGGGGASGNACGCRCTVTGTCTGNVTIYEDNACTSTDIGMATADGSCQDVNGGVGGGFTAGRSVMPPDATGVTCAVMSDPEPTAARQLCCRM